MSESDLIYEVPHDRILLDGIQRTTRQNRKYYVKFEKILKVLLETKNLNLYLHHN